MANQSTRQPDFVWRRAARRTARKINAGHWIEVFAPLLVGFAAVAFGVILAMRSKGSAVTASSAWPFLAGGVVICAAIAFFVSRRRFATEADGLVRIEARLHLRNALSAAVEGVRPWPDPPKEMADGFTWRWLWLATPAALAGLCLAAAFLIPVRADAGAAVALSPPLAWPQMASWVEELKEARVADPKHLDEIEKRLDALRAQPEKDWYGHHSLEATDNLRDGLQRSISEAGNNLEKAARSINALEKFSDQISAQTREKILAEFDAALEGLQSGELKIDPQWLERLSALDLKNIGSLSKEQLAQLREGMKSMAEACKACRSGSGGEKGFLGDGKGEDDEQAALLALIQREQQGFGRGGIDRGPGAAPLFLGDDPTKLGTRNTQAVSNPDLSRTAPADLVGINNDKHEVDKTKTGPIDAGAVQHAGEGGEQVWKQEFTPEERAVLKRFFN